ncbi:MAG: hypothetical protein R2851_15105 [Caldilineaceae bacterium]
MLPYSTAIARRYVGEARRGIRATQRGGWRTAGARAPAKVVAQKNIAD